MKKPNSYIVKMFIQTYAASNVMHRITPSKSDS